MNHGVHSVHEGNKGLQDKHWQGQYFGPAGAVIDSKRAYEHAYGVYAIYGTSACKQEYLQALMAYLSTLYSAINHALRQIAKFKLLYVSHFLDVYDELRIVFREVMKRREELDAGQKEVLMAVLLVMRIVYPFSGYRVLAITIGENILGDYWESVGKPSGAIAFSTYMLVKARLSRISRYRLADSYRCQVKDAIGMETVQRELGWKTINRLARLIGDEEMVKHSAKMDGSPDIKLKSRVA